MKRVELRATTAEETLRAYAPSVIPEATTTAKKESVEEKEKEEHLIEIAQRRDENEHDERARRFEKRQGRHASRTTKPSRSRE